MIPKYTRIACESSLLVCLHVYHLLRYIHETFWLRTLPYQMIMMSLFDETQEEMQADSSMPNDPMLARTAKDQLALTDSKPIRDIKITVHIRSIVKNWILGLVETSMRTSMSCNPYRTHSLLHYHLWFCCTVQRKQTR